MPSQSMDNKTEVIQVHQMDSLVFSVRNGMKMMLMKTVNTVPIITTESQVVVVVVNSWLSQCGFTWKITTSLSTRCNRPCFCRFRLSMSTTTMRSCERCTARWRAEPPSIALDEKEEQAPPSPFRLSQLTINIDTTKRTPVSTSTIKIAIAIVTT